MTTTAAGQSHLNIGGRVLAAIDTSAYTDSVCSHAAWAAARLEAPLEFVHVLERQADGARFSDLSGNLALGTQEALLEQLVAVDEAQGKLAQERGRLLLRHAQSIATAQRAIEAETRLRHGGLVDTLLDLEDGVRLYVLGKRGEHADFAQGHLGSELERVVRAVHRPILVASRAFADIARVLVAFDGSATTRKGIEMVAASPLFRGLHVDVVTVGKDGDAAQAQLRWALDTLSRAGLDNAGRIVAGEPDDVIAGLVQDERIDLLVMGAYGHSRIRRLIVGSTTTTMLRTCRIPVLLLR